MTSAVGRHQANREHMVGHGFEQEQAMALADVIEGLTADIGAKLEKTSSEIKASNRELTAEIKASNRELTADIKASNRKPTDEVWLTWWRAGIAAGFAGVAAAGTVVAVLVYLLFTQA